VFHGAHLEVEFFALLVGIDEEIVGRVADAGCPDPDCKGPLHRGDYARKPRGALVATAGEAFVMRFSLCCGWCRCRTLPPSVRFLGRRVYFGAVVLLGCLWALCGSIEAAGVPVRTVRRWLGWWSSSFPPTPTWVELRARFAPPPPRESLLPLSLIERLADGLGPSDSEKILLKAAQFLAPVTTQSCPDASRFVRVG